MKIRMMILAAAMLTFAGCQSAHEHSSQTQSSAKGKPYPLKTCIVTDEKLGGHGDAVSFVHEGQEIKICCDGCREDFNKEPAKYLKKLAGK